MVKRKGEHRIMKVEILAGGGIKTAFKELGIEATRKYKGAEKPHYQVWELEKSDMCKMSELTDWKDHYGWWRHAKGSNMGTACSIFTVNGHELIAWDGTGREDLRDDWDNEPIEEKEAYHYSYKEYEEVWKPHKYDTLLDYFCEELGASLPNNICALAVDLARTNGLTMSELFKKFEG